MPDIRICYHILNYRYNIIKYLLVNTKLYPPRTYLYNPLKFHRHLPLDYPFITPLCKCIRMIERHFTLDGNTKWICGALISGRHEWRTILSAMSRVVPHTCPTWSGLSTMRRPTMVWCCFPYRVESNNQPNRRLSRRASWGGLETRTSPVWRFLKNWKKNRPANQFSVKEFYLNIGTLIACYCIIVSRCSLCIWSYPPPQLSLIFKIWI